MPLSQADKDVLRALIEEQAEIASLPIHIERAELWRRLNQLEPVRPMVWINEVPWNEMNFDDELTLRASDGWARGVEWGLRALLYQWRHFPGDMIVNDYLSSPIVHHSTGLGIHEQADIARTDPTSGVVSRKFHRQILEPSDVDKIKLPTVSVDERATNEQFERLSEIAGDVLPVRKVGRKNLWFAPWDELIRWWGVEDGLRDLADRPDMVNEVMSRLVDAYLHELDQLEALNLLSPNNDNTRIGSGGYGYTAELPLADFDPARVRTQDMWGCATAQIFSEVSPPMHWEFAIRHELRWLERWGLTYYGCCEPLDIKVDVLRRVPNLRKLSMSPWIDLDRAVNKVGTDFVFSRKPNPAVLAFDVWHPEIARRELVEFLDKARGCRCEIILKDISTVRYEPQRLWEWESIASELAQEYAL